MSQHICIFSLKTKLTLLKQVLSLNNGMDSNHWKTNLIHHCISIQFDPSLHQQEAEAVWFCLLFPTMLWFLGQQGNQSSHLCSSLFFFVIWLKCNDILPQNSLQSSSSGQRNILCCPKFVQFWNSHCYNHWGRKRRTKNYIKSYPFKNLLNLKLKKIYLEVLGLYSSMCFFPDIILIVMLHMNWQTQPWFSPGPRGTLQLTWGQ